MDSGRGVSRGRAAWWRWGAALALLLGLLGGGLPAAGVARAAGDVTITVTSVADASGGGGGCTLRDAIAVANAPGTPVGGCAAAAAAGGSGTTLAFALPGAGPWAITLGSALPPIGVPLTLRGPGAALLTIRRDAAATPPPPAFRLLESGSDLTVADVTLTGGDAGGGAGGGFYALGAVTVTGSTLSGNSAANDGGGFFAGNGATVTGSTLSGNSAVYGGGGFWARGNATVVGSTLSGNTAFSGGGFWAGDATVAGSTLSGNSAGYRGGGFYAYNGATVAGSTLSGNTATNDGGGFSARGGFRSYGDVTVTGSTLSGNTALSGGGFWASGALTVTDSTLSGNTASDNGGGFYAEEGATVTGSTLSGNSAGFGGGFYAYGPATAAVTDSTLSGNTAAGFGGGFFAVGDVTVAGSTLSGNSAGSYDGGGFWAFGDATVIDSTLSGNSATYGNGGGFYAEEGATVTGSTLSGNSAVYGGGFYARGAATVAGSTLSGNSAFDNGGGFYVTSATVTNSVFAAGARGANCVGVGGEVIDAGGVIASDASCGGGGAGSLANADPRLAPLADYGGPTATHAPRADSPARGAGAAADCAARPADQRGVARPATGCDSGAYQSVPVAVAPAALPGGTVGAAYQAQLTADGGAAPQTFAVTAGALPGGLALAAGGALGGTPTAAGTARFTVTATDALGATGSRAYSVTVDKVSQTIAFDTPGGNPAYSAGETFTIGATASSGLAVGFAAAGACAVSGTTVTATAAGTCTVTASQAGDATHAAAPDVARTFPIAAAPPSPGPSPSTGPAPAFADVPADYWAHDQIVAFAGRGLTTGCGDDAQGRRLYCPERGVTRAEMAVFLTRTLGQAQHAPPASPTFADVPADHWAYGPIERFVALGLTTGCGDDAQGRRLYCPDRGVTRAEMAVFLTRTLGQDRTAPPASPTFADVPADHWAYGPIERFVALGLTTGCGDDTQGRRLYCPDRGVTRAEMAVFIIRAYP